MASPKGFVLKMWSLAGKLRQERIDRRKWSLNWYFAHCCEKVANKKEAKGGRDYLCSGSGVGPYCLRSHGSQNMRELVAVTIRKQREMNVGVQGAFSYLHSSRLQSTLRAGLPISANPS